MATPIDANTNLNRRDFVKATTIGSTLGLATIAAAESTKEPNRQIKVGQIGTKHAHADGQMKTLRALTESFEVVGVVEPDDKRWDRIANSNTYRGLSRLTESQLLQTSDLEVVAIETEIRNLLATAQRCIDSGLHVHVDKPAGESLEQLKKLQDAARRQSLTIQMGYMYRYNPGFEFLYNAVAEGWLGRVFEVHAVMSKTSSDSARAEMAEYPGGAMFELGCHLIDPLTRILGTPTSITPFHKQTRSDQDLLDNTLAVFEYPNATATIRSALVEVDGSRRRQFVVCGDQGTIAIRPLETPHVELTLAKPQGKYPKGTTKVELPKSPGRYHGAWTALANAVRRSEPFYYTPEHDYTVQRAILAASGVVLWD